jgi:DNA-binding response OmpR family regulator
MSVRTHGAPRPVRVLIVDDDRDGADSLCVLLGLHGHQCRAAYDARAALAEAESFLPEVALLDLGMPVSGYDLARELLLRERPPLLVALTGYSDETRRRQAAEGGFGHYLVKPAHPQEVLGVLESFAAGC